MKSTAPPLIAFTAVGTSPCAADEYDRDLDRLAPQVFLQLGAAHAGQPHVEHQAARVAAPVGLDEAVAVAKVCTAMPFDSISHRHSVRIDSSSSTT